MIYYLIKMQGGCLPGTWSFLIIYIIVAFKEKTHWSSLIIKATNCYSHIAKELIRSFQFQSIVKPIFVTPFKNTVVGVLVGTIRNLKHSHLLECLSCPFLFLQKHECVFTYFSSLKTLTKHVVYCGFNLFTISSK